MPKPPAFQMPPIRAVLGWVVEKKAESYFLKIRVAPTKGALHKSGICLDDTPTCFSDTFFDDDNHSLGSKNQYLRSRLNVDTNKIEHVFQEGIGSIKEGILIYSERKAEKDEFKNQKETVLNYTFKRWQANSTPDSDIDIYFDWVTDPVDYQVMSIRKKVKSEDIQDIYIGFCDVLIRCMGVMESVVLEAQAVQRLLVSSTEYLPLRTKFMAMLQVTPNFMLYYKIYKQYDCIQDPIEHSRSLLQLAEEDPSQKEMAVNYVWWTMESSFAYACAWTFRQEERLKQVNKEKEKLEDDEYCKEVIKEKWKFDLDGPYGLCIMDDIDF